ncbi:hypothetical protein G9A89_011952 [Geosiphon pyriformis]|nr:hypothetical protein G9A89_011952 [Geosiphon pyriformis]
MTTTKAKSKKAAPNICSEISNKISTKEVLSVVETIRQNVLEAFSLPSNRDKLPLIATKATFLSLAGFSPVKSPKVFNNRPVNNLVFSSIDSTPGASSTTSSKKMVKKTKSSENIIQHVVQDEPRLTTGCVVKYGVFWQIVAVHGFLGAKSVLKDNMKLFCVEFASLVSLEAVFLVELISSVHLAPLKIVKSLVVSELDSPFAAVALCDVLLNVSAANIKTALSVFGSVIHVVLKPLDSAVSTLNHWSVLVGKNSVRILPLVNQQETIMSHDRFKAKLVNLPPGCTAFEISNMVSQVGADLDLAVVKTDHLAVDYKVAPLFPSKTLKMFKPYFVGSLSYVKTSVPFVLSEFSSLVAAASLVAVVDSLVISWLTSLKSDLAKLSVLVESIVKPVGSMVKVFEQFVNGNLVLSSVLDFRVNKILVHMNIFMVALKTEYSIGDINMSGFYVNLLSFDKDMFSNLMFLWEHESAAIKADVFETAK